VPNDLKMYGDMEALSWLLFGDWAVSVTFRLLYSWEKNPLGGHLDPPHTHT